MKTVSWPKKKKVLNGNGEVSPTVNQYDIINMITYFV